MKILASVVLLAFCSSLSAQTCVPERDKYGHIARSRNITAEFRRNVPCPATGLIQKRCFGFVIDHIKPLACCGADAVSNMQWQTIAEGKLKDKWERKNCGGD